MRTPFLRNEIDRVVDSTPWPDGCVLFSGRKQPNGYGRVSVDGQYRRAHVYACERAHGPRPTGKRDAAHSCGEAMCINPAHLRWASRAENEADKRLHGRANTQVRASHHILDQERADEIRQRYAAGGVTQQALADEYGVHIVTINGTIKRRHWKGT